MTSVEKSDLQEKYPRAKKVQVYTHAFDEHRAAWEIDSDPTTGGLVELQFFSRTFEEGPKGVIVARYFSSGHRQEREDRATLSEMVDFAIRANEDVPDDPVSSEILRFVNDEIEGATRRLASLAIAQP